jgi:DNA-binding beta-propeller fold protein YncE
MRSRFWSVPRICALMACALLSGTGMQAQTVLTTIPVDGSSGLAVNPATNIIYASGPELNAIDGTTNAVTAIKAAFGNQVVVNPSTNTIYVVDSGDFCPDGCKPGTDYGHIFVVNGATNAVTTLAYDPNVQFHPVFAAVNPVTNKLYVANYLSNNITIVDGATNTMTTIGDSNTVVPVALAVNSTTNKIYVVTGDHVTVIDGATNAMTSVIDPNAVNPNAVVVNEATNKIYVANLGDDGQGNNNYGNITVIDGSDNSTTTVTDPNALAPGTPGCILGGSGCQFQPIAVDSATNKIYVANSGSFNGTTYNVTVIDGATNSTKTISDPNAYRPSLVTVDSTTNKIYVVNLGPALIGAYPYTPGSMTVIDGATNAVSTIINPTAGAVSLALDETTDRVYVGDGSNVTVIDAGAAPVSHNLGVVFQGAGSGTVTSNSPGINCGTDCAGVFNVGAVVNLTAVPASNSAFVGWGMSCSGSGACNVSMNSDQFVGANFVAQDFSIAAASTDLSVQPGGQVTDVLTITPLNVLPFAGTIQFACNMLTGNFGDTIPAPACTFSPASVSPGSNTASTTMTITAQPAAKLAAAGLLRNDRALFGLWLTPILGLTLLAGWKKQKRTHLMLCGGLLSLFLLQAACGGSGTSSGPPPPPPPQNFTAYVTATSGATQHVVQISVTVQ